MFCEICKKEIPTNSWSRFMYAPADGVDVQAFWFCEEHSKHMLEIIEVLAGSPESLRAKGLL